MIRFSFNGKPQANTAICADACGLPLNDSISSMGVANLVQTGEFTVTANPYESPEPAPPAANAMKWKRFSLPEILVVIGIVGVLAALITASDSKCKTRRHPDSMYEPPQDDYATTRRSSLRKSLQATPFTGCLRKTQMRTSC